ncbi:hypothetical protein Nepgr_017017 [Nepenthes gracilis]|uniref:Uncharacterized protein n=1 Tax=Nepenthes gracilis TaxID=150966 RepID=A0AAD3SRA8_NEPGR|nr:hypothetical protein Nepgr_017017 [Nepenthes gracilis]
MFFEGCPRRLGCTVLLRGSFHEELKKVKHVVQYAVFAAYHLSPETSFLSDEDATLPKMTLKPTVVAAEGITADNVVNAIPYSATNVSFQSVVQSRALIKISGPQDIEIGLESSNQHLDSSASTIISEDTRADNVLSDRCFDDSTSSMAVESGSLTQHNGIMGISAYPCDIVNHPQTELLETIFPEVFHF